VKRLLPCVILAFAFHAIILSIDFSWLRFATRQTLAARSLTITLAVDRPQKLKRQATRLDKQTERPLEPTFDRRPRESVDAAETPAPVKQSAQLQKPLPTTPPENMVKKIRRKLSLKALTFKKQEIKTIEATQAASPPKPQPVRQPFPADVSFTRKTQHVPDSSSEPVNTAAVLPDTQRDDTLSGTVLKLARPLYKQNTAPPYPRKARRLGYEGIVMLKVLINETGRVDDLMVFKSSGHTVLDRAALSAVRKWLFEPGTEGGIKKKMWVKIPVRFDLK
jgi:protein TonB